MNNTRIVRDKNDNKNFSFELFGKNIIKMKKSIIYTLCILLSGALTLNSCEDMLNVDSKRVIYEYGDLTLGDSVYSVLGILKSVQKVADRQVLLGELRGDLVSVNPTKAVFDIQELSNFTYDSENKYIAAKDYYAIINNCNLFLHRVDTTLIRDNKKLMLREFVAVQSLRSWTYMQLAMNYGRVPYFKEPILTHSAAKEILADESKFLDMAGVANELVKELAPFEDPVLYPMPYWTGITSGDGKNINTSKLFPPIRLLLGELNLWLGNYDKAAQYYYKMIYDNKFIDKDYRAYYSDEEGFIVNSYSANFNADAVTKNNSLFLVPMSTSIWEGYVSELPSIFAPHNVLGGNQVLSSPGCAAISKRQTTLYRYEDPNTDEYDLYYNPNTDFTGDMRILATTSIQRDILTNSVYSGIINKHNLSSHFIDNDELVGQSGFNEFTNYVRLYRAELLYMRLAEAALGLARNGAYGALEMAMSVLKEGLYDENKDNDWNTYKYTIINNPVYSKEPVLDANGEPKVDENGEPIYKTLILGDSIKFDFTDPAFDGNEGIHSRGSGPSEYNEYYSLSDTCIARYYGFLKEESEEGYEETITFNREVTRQDSLNYITDLIVDELAMEFAFEGYRFTDLIRIAKATNDNDALAKRVAAREYSNTVPYRSESDTQFEYDTDLYNLLSSEENWYLPLPVNIEFDFTEQPEDGATDNEDDDSTSGEQPSAPEEGVDDTTPEGTPDSSENESAPTE